MQSECSRFWICLFLMLLKNVVSPFFIFFMDWTLDQKLGFCFNSYLKYFIADNAYCVISHNQFSQFSHSVVSDSLWPHGIQHASFLSTTSSWNFLKLMSIESVIPSNHLILCHILLFLPSVFPSIRVFTNKSAFHMRWPQYWSFSFDLSPSNEYSGLVSFRIDWFDLTKFQGTLQSLQHHSSKPSILQCSTFFMV